MLIRNQLIRKIKVQTSDDIIKAYGGEIKVETKEGEGSEFYNSFALLNNIVYILNLLNHINPMNHGSDKVDIIKAHGGEIKVETKEGEGSEFIMQWPLKENL